MNYFIYTSHHFTLHRRMNSINWPRSQCVHGFIAQLVEHRTGIAEVTVSNPVETLIFFRLLLSNCLNWKIYCDDHSSLWSTTAVQIYELFHIYFTSKRELFGMSFRPWRCVCQQNFLHLVVYFRSHLFWLWNCQEYGGFPKVLRWARARKCLLFTKLGAWCRGHTTRLRLESHPTTSVCPTVRTLLEKISQWQTLLNYF